MLAESRYHKQGPQASPADASREPGRRPQGLPQPNVLSAKHYVQ